jgi:hypothetical protein
MSRKFKFHYNPTIITGTSHEDLRTFMIVCRSIVIRMRNISDKIKTHFISNNFPPHPQNRAVYEIMRKSMIELDRPHVTV